MGNSLNSYHFRSEDPCPFVGGLRCEVAGVGALGWWLRPWEHTHRPKAPDRREQTSSRRSLRQPNANSSSESKGRAYWEITDATPNEGLASFDQYFLEYRKEPTGNEGFEIPWFSATVSDTSYHKNPFIWLYAQTKFPSYHQNPNHET